MSDSTVCVPARIGGAVAVQPAPPGLAAPLKVRAEPTLPPAGLIEPESSRVGCPQLERLCLPQLTWGAASIAVADATPPGVEDPPHPKSTTKIAQTVRSCIMDLSVTSICMISTSQLGETCQAASVLIIFVAPFVACFGILGAHSLATAESPQASRFPTLSCPFGLSYRWPHPGLSS